MKALLAAAVAAFALGCASMKPRVCPALDYCMEACSAKGQRFVATAHDDVKAACICEAGPT